MFGYMKKAELGSMGMYFLDRIINVGFEHMVTIVSLLEEIRISYSSLSYVRTLGIYTSVEKLVD